MEKKNFLFTSWSFLLKQSILRISGSIEGRRAENKTAADAHENKKALLKGDAALKRNHAFTNLRYAIPFVLLFVAHGLMVTGSPLLEDVLVEIGVLAGFLPCLECVLFCTGIETNRPDHVQASLVLHHFVTAYFLLRFLVSPVWQAGYGVVSHHPYLWIGGIAEMVLIVWIYIMQFRRCKFAVDKA